MMKVLVLATFVGMLAMAAAAPLWGADGHEITARVAQSLLQDDVASIVNKILEGQSLQEVSTWADYIKYQSGWAWSKPLHFIDTPDWACDYSHARDCSNNVCVAGAISNYTQQIASGVPSDEANIALKFLTHFVGDIHQPLHVAFASDYGGNSIKGEYNGDHVNLHHVWDSSILLERMDNDFSSSDTDYTNYLLQQISGPWAANASKWSACDFNNFDSCISVWANGTAGTACMDAYRDSNGDIIKDNFNLGEDYYNARYEIVDRQLAMGGVRLAAVLNHFLGSSAMPDELPSNNKMAPMWGQDGHFIVASIAMNYLSSDVTERVSQILNGQTLADVASWADEVDHHGSYTWSKALHYINVPFGECTFSLEKDCADNWCVAGAIANYTSQLTSSDFDTQNVALKFVTHFVGDIHQPLHVSYASDHGGNSLHGDFLGRSTNLHRVWDTNILDERLHSDFNGMNDYIKYYIDSIDSGEFSSEVASWKACDESEKDCTSVWANESLDITCHNVYEIPGGDKVSNGFNLGQDYYEANIPRVEKQIAKAGVRLAQTLNGILGSTHRYPRSVVA